eukprot:Gb_25452 [translate_table: standard]
MSLKNTNAKCFECLHLDSSWWAINATPFKRVKHCLECGYRAASNVDGELKDLYRLSPIAVIGGSFLPGLAGHNIAEAAAAGCAVLTGPHIGHFVHMVSEMQRSFPLSVQQVSGKVELLGVLQELFDNAKCLEARRDAAKQASAAAAAGVLQRVWCLLDTLVLRKAFEKAANLYDSPVNSNTN